MKLSRTRRAILAGGAALMLGGAAIGIVGAQEIPTPVLGDKHVIAFEAKLPGDFEERHRKFLEALAGKLGVESARLEQAIDEVSKEQGMPFPVLGKAPVAAVAISLGDEQRVIAEALNISTEQLQQEWKEKTLAEVAAAHNVDPQAVKDAVAAHRRAKIDELVQAGKLPAEKAERIKEHMDKAIDALLNHPLGEKMVNLRAATLQKGAQ